MRKTILTMATAFVALMTGVGTASAATTFDPSCPYTPSNATGRCGFVGKGDVQTALGYNNTRMQKDAGNLRFSYSQPASQALSQDATQAGTQGGTESMSESLSCTVEQRRVRFTREGSREGSRDGTQNGTRSGSRAGAVNGTVSYSIAYDARVKNQINGFFLTGATSSGFVASGDPVWGAESWNDWSWNDWSWGATAWGDWDSAPGENPSVCLSGNPGVTDVDDVVSEGAITTGEITTDDAQYGAIQPGAVTTTGAARVYVNNVALN